MIQIEPEKVPLFLIYKQGTGWKTESSPEINDWQLLGFLTALTEDLRQKMAEEFTTHNDEGLL